MLRYIRFNNTLGLNYYAGMKYAPLSGLFRKSGIKTKNQLMNFSGSSWQYFLDTGRSIVSYIIFYKGGTIYHGKNVSVQVSKSST